MIEQGDIVKFYPSSDEIYPYITPEPGSIGEVKTVTLNIGLMQLMGVEIPMCLVQFSDTLLHVYTEDLRLVKKQNTTSTDSSTEFSVNDHIN